MLGSAGVQVFHCIPDVAKQVRAQGTSLVIGVFETLDPPKHWKDILNRHTAVLCPSRFCVEEFNKIGLKKPVFYWPHAIDFQIYKPSDSHAGKGSGRSSITPYTFLWIGQWKQRKGYQELLEAFCNEFKGENVQLTMVTRDIGLAESYITTSSFAMKYRPTPQQVNLIPSGYLTDEQMADIIRSADCVVQPSYAEGFGLCFGKDSEVLIPGGAKKIKGIAVGDTVFDAHGKETKVIRISHRPMRNNEHMVKILVQGNELNVTEDHKVLVYDYRRRTKKQFYGNEFKEAKNVQVGDYVFMPKVEIKKEIPDMIDVVDYIQCPHDANLVWYKCGFSGRSKWSIASISEKTGYSKCQIEYSRRFLRGEINNCSVATKGLLSFFNENDIHLPVPNKYPRYIKIDADFLYLAGWYIAEGSGRKSSMELSMGVLDNPYVEGLCQIMRKLGMQVKVYRKANHIEIIGCGLIAGLFPILFGAGSHNKKIPDFLFANNPRIVHLLRGYILGDGYFKNPKRHNIRTTSVSKIFTQQLHMLLSSMGYWNTMKRWTKKNSPYIGYEVMVSGKYADRLSEDSMLPFHKNKQREGRNHVYDIGDGYLVPVRRVEKYSSQDDVYDLSIESDDRAFVVNDMVAHNCGLQSLACGIPLITTNFAGATDYATSENSYLLEPNGLQTLPQLDRYPQFFGKKWAKIDVSRLQTLMRKVFSEQGIARQKALRASPELAKRYSYPVVGEIFCDILKNLA
jgi:intein/homing endonuclease